MLSFRGSGLECSVEEARILRVSGASLHKFGLEAELLVLDLSGRVTKADFSKVHCWSWEATATSTMLYCRKGRNGKNDRQADRESGRS